MIPELFSEYRPDIRGGSIRGRNLAPVSIPKAKPEKLGPETSWSYFHPSRVDARYAPSEFRTTLHAIDPNLDITWHPVRQRWLVWVRNPRVTHWMCPGWQLLFVVKDDDGGYLPLDRRTLATVYDRSPRKWGNAKRYFDEIVAEVRANYVAGQRRKADLVGAVARDRFDAVQIKNIGHGSKFALHHSGN